jgi:aryl-alcohol dehydrogenase-like predicted oxidoreductase
MRPANARRETSDIVSDIQRSCEGSLRRLQVRFLDLLVFEWVDNPPLDEMLKAAEAVTRAGVVRHIAVSDFPAWRVMDWLGRSGRRKLRELAVVQNELSLGSNAGMSAETLAVAREHRLGFVADSPLASGFFTARPSSPHIHDNGRVRLLRETGSAVPAMAEVNAISQALGTSPARVALAWVLAHPNVSSALIDAMSIAELDDFAGATALNLSISDLLSLDRRWRMNPGGTTDDGPDTLGTETVDTGYGAVSVGPVSCGQAVSPRLVSAR